MQPLLNFIQIAVAIYDTIIVHDKLQLLGVQLSIAPCLFIWALIMTMKVSVQLPRVLEYLAAEGASSVMLGSHVLLHFLLIRKDFFALGTSASRGQRRMHFLDVDLCKVFVLEFFFANRTSHSQHISLLVALQLHEFAKFCLTGIHRDNPLSNWKRYRKMVA